ncbi:MAG: VOC family protein [Pseudomonadota bacterium]
MFKAVHPVCPVTDLPRTVAFWQRLGFRLDFADHPDLAQANYAGVVRDGLSLHLQTFTPDQLGEATSVSLRIEMDSKDALDALEAEWGPHGVITAPIGDRDWGNREFGFYDPDKMAIFFFVSIGN